MRVLVVGSGIAGLTAALRADAAGHHVAIVTKGAIAESNTRHAQGGIAAAWFADDSPELHAADTLRAGDGLSDEHAVRVLCEGGPAAIRELIASGVVFDTATDGGSELARGREAAHSTARVLHAGGDASGAVIEAALVAAVRARPIAVREHTLLVELLVHGGRAVGIEAQLADGERIAIDADAVILATGGAGQLFRHTTNPAIATGDGIAAAWRAGARVTHLEFYQFHPTALALPGRFLVSEAVRGEGAALRNSAGERFMLRVHPDAELAPRDVVARAMADEMAAQNGLPVLLDATALGRELLESRFPTISKVTREAGLDWTSTPIPVTPAAHYLMGGIVTDLDGRSTLDGLYAIGEVARTGVHGANRLASNSLLEGAVFAARAVDSLAATAPNAGTLAQHTEPTPTRNGVSHGSSCIWDRDSGGNAGGAQWGGQTGERSTAREVRGWKRDELQQLMWAACGLHRTGAELEAAAATLASWTRPETGPGSDVSALEDANLLDTARLMIAAALARGESVGAHFRSDADAGARADRHSLQSENALQRVSSHTRDTREEAIAC